MAVIEIIMTEKSQEVRDCVPIVVLATIFFTTFLEQLFPSSPENLFQQNQSYFSFSWWFISSALTLLIITDMFRLNAIYQRLKPVMLLASFLRVISCILTIV
jgi:hypothetical protein